ncbi:DUF874 domain-containing protein [Ruegeria marina]|uniref:Uncharacterized protein involved in exopolysaccharide biosynthesis n=1 Tax=Ruegeria marina TaxID=639004 RepID=A0A1G6T4J5_9RHOB|nr:DUF874 domain-containing protein [Ruegeria marina]SDD24080.1 Uncharacterized protein involved in exopolysaccharide biosynthesis [Ruegeria marina]
MGPIHSISDVVDMLRRRARLIIAVIFVGSLLSLYAAMMHQHEYESHEVIQIARPVVSDELASSTVEGSAARRLQLIQQVLTTRGTMLEIIEKYGIYDDLPALKPQAKVTMLRNAIRIEGIAAAREGYADDGAISVLSITARMATPELAQQVAHEFGQRTVELSKQSRIENARATLNFFDAQKAALEQDVETLEAEIEAYRATHQLSLPGAVEARRDEIRTINDGLLDIARERIQIERAIELALQSERPATAERLRKDLGEQLATLDAQRDLLEERKYALERLIEGSPEVERVLGAYDRSLDQLRDQLAQVASRRNEAEMGFLIEAERQAERLMVIEEAALPDYPVTESRKKIALLGLAASIGLALALAYVLEWRNPVIRSADQMERELGFRPVVVVPFLDASAPRPSLWRRMTRRFRGSRAPAE